MQVDFVSDIHGNVDALADVARRSEQLVVLGDLLDYVDYHNPGAGILGTVFGAERVRRFGELRAANNFDELNRYNAALWHSVADPVGTLSDVVHERYLAMRGALELADRKPLLILGNVDVAASWDQVAGAELATSDGAVVELGGLRFGFVGGGVRRARPAAESASAAVAVPGGAVAWRPYVRDRQEYAAAVAGLGAVDVLCSHLPPRLALLRYDRVTARLEAYGPGLLESVDSHQPLLAVSGHVHQPLSPRQARGRTQCVNVGHFARRPHPYRITIG